MICGRTRGRLNPRIPTLPASAKSGSGYHRPKLGAIQNERPALQRDQGVLGSAKRVREVVLGWLWSGSGSPRSVDCFPGLPTPRGGRLSHVGDSTRQETPEKRNWGCLIGQMDKDVGLRRAEEQAIGQQEAEKGHDWTAMAPKDGQVLAATCWTLGPLGDWPGATKPVAVRLPCESSFFPTCDPGISRPSALPISLGGSPSWFGSLLCPLPV